MTALLFAVCIQADEVLLPYSSYLGGDANDYATAVAVDSLEDFYVVGRTASTNFPTLNALQPLYGGGDHDVFVSKFTSNGSAIVYSTYIGGSGDDRANAIQVCPDGGICIVGYTTSTNFPVTNAYQAVHSAGEDAFVTRVSASGTSLVYSTYLGGSGNDSGTAASVGPDGALFVAGNTTSANFPITNAYQTASAGGTDFFVSRLSPGGSNLQYSTYLGGSGASDLLEDIAVDPQECVHIVGHTDSSDFPTSAPLQSAHAGGTYDAVVSCLSSNGDSLLYSTFLGGSASDRGMDISLDRETNAYVTGYTRSTNFPTRGPFMPSLSGAYDSAFLSKLSAGENQLIYSTYLGGTRYDFGYAVAVDAVGQAYVAGKTSSTNFPTKLAYQNERAGTPLANFYDAFITKFSISGAGLVYSTYLGGDKSESGIQMDIDSIDKVYLVGETRSTNLPTASPYQAAHAGGYTDAFISEFQLLLDLQFLRIRNSSTNVIVQWAGGPQNTQLLMQADSLLATPSWTCVATTQPPYEPFQSYTTGASEAETRFYRVETPSI